MSFLSPLILSLVVLAADAPRAIDVKSIEWEVPDAPVVLGIAESVELTIKANRPDGSVLDVAAPELWASTGTVTTPVRTGPGVFTTTFTPPKERFPHVAILSATVETKEGPAVGFVALPLWGQGKLEVKTKPLSDVVIYLGNEAFGPVKADERGVARVDIKAPPGPENAVAESKDLAGNVSTKTVPLSVPPFSRLAVMPIDQVASADGTGESRLLLFVIDRKGSPLFDATATESKSSVGRLEGPTGLAPGLFRLRLIPGETTEPKAIIDVTLKNAKNSSATTEIRLIPGGPERATIEASLSTLRADENGIVDVEARFYDKAKNTTPRQTAKLVVDAGRLEPATDAVNDGVKTRWVLPETRGVGEARLSVVTPDGKEIGFHVVTFTAGPPASVAIESRDDIVADGRSALAFSIRAKDIADNPVPAAGATVVVSQGDVVGINVDGASVVGRYVPTPTRDEGRAKIVVTLGAATAEKEIRLIPPPLPFMTFMPSVRADWNYGGLFAGGPSMHTLVRIPGLLDETLHVGADLAWLPSVPSTLTTDDETLIRFHQAFPVSLEAAWRPLVFDIVRLHAGAGAGFVVGDFSLANDRSLVPQRSIIFSLGGALVLGAGVKLGPGELEAMWRLGYYVPVSGPQAFAGTPIGTSLTVGYRFGL